MWPIVMVNGKKNSQSFWSEAPWKSASHAPIRHTLLWFSHHFILHFSIQHFIQHFWQFSPRNIQIFKLTGSFVDHYLEFGHNLQWTTRRMPLNWNSPRNSRRQNRCSTLKSFCCCRRTKTRMSLWMHFVYECTLHWSTLTMRSTLESRVLHQFEVASLANHLPESAEEAKSLESFRDLSLIHIWRCRRAI